LKNEIVKAMISNPRVSAKTLSGVIGINTRNTQKHIAELKKLGVIERIGSPKGGHWVIKKEG
jgi:predicted HTH transcriptional regulator